MIPFNLTALTLATPLIQWKPKNSQNLPYENPPKFYPIIIHSFNFQPNQMLHFKSIFFSHSTTAYQKENHGWNELSIYLWWRLRNGNTTHLPVQWWEWTPFTLLITYSTAAEKRPWYVQCHFRTNSSTTRTNVMVQQLCPLISNHPANFVDLRWR